MKTFKRLLLLLLLFLGIAVVYNYRKLNIISGYAAKNMASSLYISGRSENSINENDNNVPLIKLADVEVNKTEKSAEASVFGLMDRKAVYRPGLGCVLINDDELPKLSLKPRRAANNLALPFPYGNLGIRDTLFDDVDYEQLNVAVSKAFQNPEVQKTRTVLVAYKNHLLVEKYIDGFSAETPILGWSMTKSILATLYGILEYQDILDTEELAGIPSWQNDERREITLNHLLRMQSGLEWDEDYTSISDVTRMLFLESDMTKVQIDKKSLAAPGEIWNYSSGTSNLLSGILRSKFDSHQEYLDFPYTSLIDRIGMHSMTLEADLSGNYVGSSYSWASTRDWAKFGLLYLNRGNWNGDQVFAPDWVDYISKPTTNSEGVYGAHFWLNAGGKYPDVPKDLFSANGYQGQYVFIIPSKELVVVRTGLAEGENFDVNRFLADILEAIP